MALFYRPYMPEEKKRYDDRGDNQNPHQTCDDFAIFTMVSAERLRTFANSYAARKPNYQAEREF